VANKIAFINGKGGCGKTTSIFHISGILSTRDKRVLAIDFDKQRNTSDSLLMNSEFPDSTVFDVMNGQPFEKATARALFQSRGKANPKYYGTDCLPADIRLEDESLLADVDAAHFGDMLDEFIEGQGYEWVLVDMPPSNRSLNDICFANVVDYLIVPFSSDVFSVSGYGDIMETVQRARALNPSLNILGIYLSRYMANCGVDRYIREQLLNYDTFIDVQIPHAADIREGIFYGRPINYYKERVIQSWVSENGMNNFKNDGSFIEVMKTKRSLSSPPKYLVKHIQPSIHAYERLVSEIKARIRSLR